MFMLMIFHIILFALMPIETVLPESVTVSVVGDQQLQSSSKSLSECYWTMTQDEVKNYDLSYISGSWDRDMIRDGMNAVVLVSELHEVKTKEINVWKYLSEYSPPSDRGYMFSYGDDKIVTLVQNKMTVGHSGYSMGWVMRHIEFIAQYGLPAHREMVIKYPGRARCY